MEPKVTNPNCQKFENKKFVLHTAISPFLTFKNTLKPKYPKIMTRIRKMRPDKL